MKRAELLSTTEVGRSGRRALLVAALAMLAGSGCAPGLLPQQSEPPGVYLIEVPDPATDHAPAAAHESSLAIATVRSAPGFGSGDMIYLQEPHHLQAFARHRWADSPARMLEAVLVASAERSGLFRQVAAPGSQTHSALRLDTELQRLQQRFTGQQSQLELVVRVNLVDTARRQIRGTQVFRVTVAADPSPYGGVLAANRAVALFSEELVAFLRRALNAP